MCSPAEKLTPAAEPRCAKGEETGDRKMAREGTGDRRTGPKLLNSIFLSHIFLVIALPGRRHVRRLGLFDPISGRFLL